MCVLCVCVDASVCLVCVSLLSVLCVCVVLFPRVDVVMHVANPLRGAGAFIDVIVCVSLASPRRKCRPTSWAGESGRGGHPEVTALLL